MLCKVKFQCVDHVTTKHLFRTLQLDIFLPINLAFYSKAISQPASCDLAFCLIRFAGKTHIYHESSSVNLAHTSPLRRRMGDLFLIRVFKHGLYQRKSVTLAMAFCVVHLPSKSFIELWRWGFYVGKSMPVEEENASLDKCTNKHLVH